MQNGREGLLCSQCSENILLHVTNRFIQLNLVFLSAIFPPLLRRAFLVGGGSPYWREECTRVVESTGHAVCQEFCLHCNLHGFPEVKRVVVAELTSSVVDGRGAHGTSPAPGQKFALPGNRSAVLPPARYVNDVLVNLEFLWRPHRPPLLSYPQAPVLVCPPDEDLSVVCQCHAVREPKSKLLHISQIAYLLWIPNVNVSL